MFKYGGEVGVAEVIFGEPGDSRWLATAGTTPL